MGAILLNGAHVGTGSIVAAGTLVTENMKVPPKSLVMGSPGKVKRLLTHAEIANIMAYADRYVGYRLEYRSAEASRSSEPSLSMEREALAERADSREREASAERADADDVD
jgi:carbonic anhydrase/acetyltransferase-like protein (isoleucine patch superfamily)